MTAPPMPTTPDLSRRIRKALAGLFKDWRSAEVLASDAGLDLTQVAHSDRPDTFWQGILDEAGNHGKVAELLRLAGEDYPERKDLSQLLAEYRRQQGRDLPPSLTISAAVADFTGRTAEIAALLKFYGARGGTAIISGPSGVGKTALARAVAGRLRRKYPQHAIEVALQPGGRPLSPVDLLRAVVQPFRPPDEKLPEDQAELARYYCAALDGQRGVLLLDDAAGAAQVSPLHPAPEGWAVLIASQHNFDLDGAESIDLALLPLDDALAFFRRRFEQGKRRDLLAGQERFEQAAGKPEDSPLGVLALWCGLLPLALRVAAAHLNTYKNVTITRYGEELREMGLDRLKSDRWDVPATLRVAVTRLAQADPLLAARWRLLGVMPAPFDWQAAASVWGTLAEPPAVVGADDGGAWPEIEPLSEGETRAGLDELVKRSLVECDPENERYWLHSLNRRLALELVPAEALAAARLRHAWHYLRIGRHADDLYREGGDRIVPALRLFSSITQHWTAAWADLSHWDDPSALRWVNTFPAVTVFVSDTLVSARDRVELYARAAEVARKIGDRRGEGAHLSSLGSAYHRLGEVRRAIGYYEQALAISREIGDRRVEGNALGHLGLAYWSLGEVRRAIEYYEQALAIRREIGDRRGEGADLGHLGGAHAALGEMRRAIAYHEQALAVSREIGDRRGEGAHLGNLGNRYFVLSEVRRAIGYYEQALAIDREIGDRRNEGNWLGNLGNAYYALGEVRRAIEYHERALVIAQEIGDRRNEGNWLGNLGQVYADLGQLRPALAYYEQALAIKREIGDRIGEGVDLRNLGRASADQAEAPKAIVLCWASLEIMRETGDRPGEGETLSYLGYAYAAAGNYDAAMDYHRQGIALLRAAGYSYPLAEALIDLAAPCLALNDFAQASESLQEALSLSRAIEARRLEALALQGLGRLARREGNVGSARAHWQAALEIFDRLGLPEAAAVRAALAGIDPPPDPPGPASS
jgi:tetratricopeptide (TPR) repeat protein